MAARPLRSDSGEVLGLSPDEFDDWWAQHWEPGQHVAYVGPTGTGKTTAAVSMLKARRYVLALDPKGGDNTLRRLERVGFVRVDAWPPPKAILRQIEEGQPARLIVGPVVQRRADLPKLRAAIKAALESAFDTGGWTMYVDELQVAARHMRLDDNITQNLIAARDKGVSMVTSFQRPANVPRAASEMSTWLVLWRTRDVDVVNRLGEMAGRPKSEIRGAMRALEQNAVLLFSQNPDEPIVATRAPRA